MNKQDLSPEIQEALDREAKHSATDSNTSFGVLWNEHQRAFKMGALSDTAKRIHQEPLLQRIASLTEQVEQKWISVDEGLPENSVDVLSYIPAGNYGTPQYLVVYRIDKEWSDANSLSDLDSSQTVTHWQPLPHIPALTKKGE